MRCVYDKPFLSVIEQNSRLRMVRPNKTRSDKHAGALLQVHCCVRLEFILIYSQLFVFFCDMHSQKSATNIEITTCGLYCGVNVKIMRLMTFCNMFKGLKQIVGLVL